jgi:hypothetical protein
MKKPVSTNDVAIVKQFVATFGVQDHTVMFKDLDPATVPLANERANALGLQHWKPRAMNTPGERPIGSLPTACDERRYAPPLSSQVITVDKKPLTGL